MEKLLICRICLNTDVQHVVKNLQMQELYEKLTAIPTDMRPLVLCYICFAQLKTSHKFMVKCLKAEELLKQMLTNDWVLDPALVDRSALKQMSISPLEQIIYDSTVENGDIIGLETPITYDVKLEEDTSTQELPETGNSNDSEPDSEQSPSDLRDDDPLNILETATEQDELRVNKNQQDVLKREPASSTDSESDNEQSLSDSGDDIPLHSIKKSIENAIKQEVVRISDEMDVTRRNGLIKAGPIAKSIKPIPEEKISTQVKKNCYINADNAINEACKRKLTVKSDLINLEPMHTGKKPYVCNECKKGFTRSSDLIIHERIHTGERPYVCNVCKKGFTAKRDLIRHERVHNGEKPYVCNVCKKCFKQKAHLTRHVRMHTVEKQYICNECKKGFTEKSALIIHTRKHTGEKPYVCSVCKKGFAKNSDFIIHTRKHTGEKPYVCYVCKKGFNTNSHLTKHVQIHTYENSMLAMTVRRVSLKRVIY